MTGAPCRDGAGFGRRDFVKGTLCAVAGMGVPSFAHGEDAAPPPATLPAVPDEEIAAIEDEPGYLFKLLTNETGSNEIYIESIQKSATRTMITLQHLDRMLDIYAAMCDRSPMESVKRQYRVMKARYLEEPQVSMSDIADREHIHKRTAEKDLDAAIECITALIFGIDAIKDLTGGN